MEPCFDLPRQRWFRVIGAVVRGEGGRRMVELDGDVGGYDVRVQGTILVGLFVGLGKHETDLHSYFSDDYYTHLIILLCMLLISMLVQQSRQDMKTFVNLLNCNISFLLFFFLVEFYLHRHPISCFDLATQWGLTIAVGSMFIFSDVWGKTCCNGLCWMSWIKWIRGVLV